MTKEQDFDLAVTARLYGPGTIETVAGALEDWRGTFQLPRDGEVEIISARPAVAAEADRFRQVSLAIEQAQAIEREVPKIAAAHWNTPWMPFNLFDFAALLLEAIPLIPDRGRFLGVGAGPGSKELIARDVFGLDAHGIEIMDELAAIGRGIGLDIETLDAGAWTGYGGFDCVWFNRAYRDAHLERLLEQRIWDCMAPGAVAICANLEGRPPESWFIVNDSWDNLRRGAWVKPYTGADGAA